MREVQEFRSAGGAQVFQIPLRLFPGLGEEFASLQGYVYLVLADGEEGPYRALIDAGSGLGDSNPDLEAGLAAVSQRLGRPLGLADLTHILITHAHIDHFGGLTYLEERTPAHIGVHELDLRVLTNYEERLTLVSRRLEEFLIEAGVGAETRRQLLDLYLLSKRVFRSVRVDFTYEAVGMRLGPFEFLHVPGHCAGHVVIRVDDFLFSGDHVLHDTSPHQAPEQITLSTGLEHYLQSLRLLRRYVQGLTTPIRLTFGGHEAPITNLLERLDQLEVWHRQRLVQTLQFLATPHTIQEVSRALFGEVRGYNVLLALEEAGAHVEYLYHRGLLAIENLQELEQANAPCPIYYRCLPCRSEGAWETEAVLRIGKASPG